MEVTPSVLLEWCQHFFSILAFGNLGNAISKPGPFFSQALASLIGKLTGNSVVSEKSNRGVRRVGDSQHALAVGR